MGQPLAAFPTASTSDRDEAETVLSRELIDLRLSPVRATDAFYLEMNGLRFGRTMIGFNRFGTDTVVDAGEISDRAIIFVLNSNGPATTVEIDETPVVCSNQAAVISPSRRVVNYRPAGGGVFVVRAELDALETQCQDVLDRRCGKHLVFDRSVDVEKGPGAQTRRVLEFILDSIAQDETVQNNSFLRASFDDLILSSLLALPNNHSEEFAADRPQVAPGLVRRAEEFLEGHATEPIGIADVVAHARCSRRVLFSAFRKSRGCTPMEFLAERRLTLARAALLSASPGVTVSSIAHECGLPHLGRFSAAYRKRFGEHPSETIRRC